MNPAQLSTAEITIAPGDRLRVALRLIERKDPDTGIFKNQRYEILEVFEHLPHMQQQVSNHPISVSDTSAGTRIAGSYCSLSGLSTIES